jgi:hypothetical protein
VVNPKGVVVVNPKGVVVINLKCVVVINPKELVVNSVSLFEDIVMLQHLSSDYQVEKFNFAIFASRRHATTFVCTRQRL